MTGNVVDERDKYIRCLCWSSVVAIVISVGCVVVGVLAIVASAPLYLFPYCLGGSAIAGIFVMMMASCNIRFYCNYVKNDRMHEEENVVKRWVCWQVVPIALTGITLVVGLGISGIWGMVQANDVINFEAKFNMTSSQDVPYAKDNLVYAICSFVFVLILSLVHIFVCCTCLCYTDTYGFTDNAHYSRRYHQTLDTRPHVPPRAVPATSVYPPYILADEQHGRDTDTNSYNSDQLRVNIPRNSNNARADPSAPPMSRDFRNNRFSSDRHLPTSDSVGVDSDDADRAIGGQQPPKYEQLFEEPPPSYNQVIEEGAFKVSHV